MAVTVTRTIMASGGNYTSFVAWEAGEQRDLVALDEVARAVCSPFHDQNAAEIIMAGWNTDATRNIVVEGSGGPFGARMPTNGTVYTLTNTSGGINTSRTLVSGQLATQPLHVEIKWIKLVGNRCIGGTSWLGLTLDGVAAWVYDGAKDTGNQYFFGLFHSHGAETFHVKMKNCVQVGGTYLGRMGGQSSSTGFTYSITAINCTLINSLNVFQWQFDWGSNMDAAAYNCLAQDVNAVGFCKTYATNASDVAPATFGEWGQTVTATLAFVDKAGNDFHLAAGDSAVMDVGTDMSAHVAGMNTVDADGDTRPQGAGWDIGADEYIAAGGGVPTPVILAPTEGETISGTYLVQVDSGE